MSARTRPTVYVLTYCRNPEQLYGSTLIFQTLRIGFPNAEVNVFDNCSAPEAAVAIQKLCVATACTFRPLQREISHPAFIQHTLTHSSADRVVFLDPDVVFWDDCEAFELPAGALFAGRRLPAFRDEYTQTITLERLHSSFLVFPDPAELRERVGELSRRHIGFAPIMPFSFTLAGRWYRLDTGAGLFAALRDRAHCFGEAELARYDHLLLGSQMDLMHSIDAADWEVLKAHHRAARAGDLAALRGIYRFQDDYFARRRVAPADLPWLAGMDARP